MSLDAIAHYRITGMLGEGGMGAVYRATDTKLGRDVAIKVLPEAFADDADRMARFERDARVLATLNHPNIAAIYGVEERALVMELVKGETLTGPLPPDAALPVARQLAEALEYAHEKGIIHRDLKPANIKVTPEGRVKILDFGLAKALSTERAAGDPASSPTLTMQATLNGVILGTAGYMSPEQARGGMADRRSDIWSFGVVLFELLAGRQLFAGDTVSDTLAAVLKTDPDWSALPAETPAAIRRLLRRCLERDSKRRMRDIGDALLELDEAMTGGTTEEQATAPARRSPWVFLPWAFAALATLVALWLGLRPTPPVPQPLMQFSVDLGPDAVVSRKTVAISPDGTRLVFLTRGPDGKLRLSIRQLNQPNATPLAGTENAIGPFFSPGGQWIGFVADFKLKKIAITGGAAITLCEVTGAGPRGATWSSIGSIILGSATGGLMSVPDNGGSLQRLTDPEVKGELTHRFPQVLPGGEAILFTALRQMAPSAEDEIGLLSLKTGQWKTVYRGASLGQYLSSGHLLFFRQRTLFGIPFDAERGEVRGDPAPLLEDVSFPAIGFADIDISQSGTVAYLARNSSQSNKPIVWLDKDGKAEPLISAPGGYRDVRLSPDGKLLALSSGGLSVYDPRREVMTSLTSRDILPGALAWAADSRHIVYSEMIGTNTLFWIRAEGGSEPQRLLESKGSLLPYSFSPDGRRLAYAEIPPNRFSDIWTIPLDITDPDHPKPGKPELFLSTPSRDFSPAFSPDGHWIAYQSGLDRLEVYVRPFPGGLGSSQISSGGGQSPVWSRDGRELFYHASDGRIMVTSYTAKGDTFQPEKPRPWSNLQIPVTAFPIFDLSPDGKRLVFPQPPAPETAKSSVHVTVLLNYLDELRRRLPVR